MELIVLLRPIVCVRDHVQSIKAVKRLKPLAALFDHESTEHRLLHDLVKKLLALGWLVVWVVLLLPADWHQEPLPEHLDWLQGLFLERFHKFLFWGQQQD